jgi:hypothetical protein
MLMEFTKMLQNSWQKKSGVLRLLSSLLVVITFPFVAGDFGYGLDASYFWGHNYIFDTGKFYSEASLIYGPLAFFRHSFAVGNNMLYGILFLTLVKTLISFFAFQVNQYYKNWNVFVVFFALYLLFTISPAIDYLMLVLILLLVLLHNKSSKPFYLFLIVFVAVEGFYIKNSIGISACALCAYYFVFTLVYKNKQYKLILLLLVFAIATLIIQGLILFGNIQGIITMFQNYYYSTIGFSENMPNDLGPNSTLLLTTMSVVYLLQVFLIRDETFRLFWLSSFFAVFSVFKHSMVRCDSGHYYSALILYLQLSIVILLVLNRINLKVVVLILVPVLCYYFNLKNKWGFDGFGLQFTNGFSNLYHFTKDYNKLNIEWKEMSNKNSENASLTFSKETMEQLGNHTVDFYPWELSYAWKNKLNWKPRSTLQSLSMHQYFDEKTATYFSGNDAPEFLVWHLNKRMYGSKTDFSATDERCLFTDDPLTTTAILRSYTPVKVENGNWILKRNKRNVLVCKKNLETSNTYDIKYWIEVPQRNNYLTTASINIKEKFTRKLKRFGFRDDIYWIEFLTKSGAYYKHRISTSFIKNDIWVGIYIKDMEEKVVYDKVTKFKISSDKTNLNYSIMSIRWNFLEINPTNSCDTCESSNIQALFLNN